MPIEPFDFTYSLTSESVQNETLNALGKNRVKEYEPKSYFFTESTLTAQANSQGAYGPVDENKFNITTQFQLADKKAYAVTSGQVLIVPQTGTGNESKVNVFIKPLRHVDVGVPIKYYVYRGLKKESFVDSDNNVVAKNETNTPFMAKVWTDLINHNKLTEPLPQIPASLFGYTTTETNTNSLDAKFFNTYDSTATDENKVYNLAIVEAGQYFGDFKDNQGGFEIVLNDGFYYQEKSDTGFQFDLNYAKSEKIVLDIADITDKPNVAEKMYRENVQNFLDPAAFYGAHITEKENGEIQFADNATKSSSKTDIFNNAVNKFYNKYKCYIYIQDNKARSFNFDGTLGTEPLKIGVSEVVTPSLYQTNGWPIIISEFEQTHADDENDSKKGFNNIAFQVKFKTADKNLTLYNIHGNCSNDAIDGNFLSNKALIEEDSISTQDYSNKINYKLVNNYNLNGTSLITKNIATFIYITHEEKEVEYFNDFFGPVAIDHLMKVNDQFSKKNARKSGSKKPKIKHDLIDGRATISNLSYSSIPYINSQNQSPTDDLFKLYILKKFDSEGNLDPHLKTTSTVDIKYSTIKTNDDYGIFEYGNKDYKVWKGQVNDVDNNDIPFKTLQLINFELEGNVTSFMHLGLMNNDYNKVIYDSLTSDTTNHVPESNANIYFHLDDTNITQTSLFRKYRLGVKVETFDLFWGVNYNIIYPSSENEVYVYTVDGYYFFTKEFSEKFNYVEEFAQADITFRPKNNYTGEFGLDWMRLNEPPEANYENSIVGGYGFTDKKEAFRALKREYITLPLQNAVYYVPYLNIYPISSTFVFSPHQIELKATLDSYDDLTKLELDYDTSLFAVQANFPANLSSHIDFDIQITCYREFNTDKYIKIMAHSQQVGELAKVRLAGIIKVCKNSTENLKKVKIALFIAETDIDNDPASNEIGSFSVDEKATLIKVLYQANIYADIIDKDSNNNPLILNLKNDNRFKKGVYFNNDGKIYFDSNVDTPDYDEKQDYIKEIIDSQFKSEYKNHFKIIAFRQRTTTDNPKTGYTEGNIQAIGEHCACLYGGQTGKRDDYSMVHEVCHGLGLWHTFQSGQITNPNQKYIYPKYNAVILDGDLHINDATDNLMSYSPKTQTLWHWQWEIMHKNLKNYGYEN